MRGRLVVGIQMLLAVTGMPAAVLAQDLFPPSPPQFAVGFRGSQPVLADVDDDGDLDAILTTNTTDDILILTNDGDGTFADPVVLSIDGKRPLRAFAGDLDGDGVTDLLIALRSEGFTHQIAVVRSLGAAGFETPVLVDLPSSAEDIELADLDADGDLDLAIALNSSGACVVMNEGGLAFGAPERYDEVGSLPKTIVSGDVDGDGDQDLAVAAVGAARLLLNQGDGKMVLGRLFSLGGLRTALAMSDLDGDGRLDVAVADSDLRYWLQNDIGEFGPPTTVNVQPSTDDFKDLLVADLDGTAPAELIAVGGDHPDVFVFYGRVGSGPSKPVIYGSTEGFPDVAIGDANGDGHSDLVLARPQVATLEVFPNRGDGRLLTRQLLTYQQWCQQAIVTDIDGDSRLDVVAIEQSDFVVYVNSGDGQFELPPLDEPTGATLFLDADFNGDGQVDIAELLSPSGIVTVKLGDGAGAFTLAWTGDVGDRSADFDAADVDGDGILDLVCVDRRAHTIDVFLGAGDGTFASGGTFPTGSPDNSGVDLGDLDGDGDADAVVLTGFSGGGGFRVMRNDGSGTFTFDRSYTTSRRARDVLIADVDLDGHLDVIVAADTVEVRRNMGDGTLMDAEPQDVGGWRLAVDDVDGDGNPDMVVTGVDSTDWGVLLNQGDGTFVVEGQYPHNDLGSVELGDLDGDGRLDVILSSSEDPNDGVHIFVNQGELAVCPADLDADGQLTIFDFLAFQNLFQDADPRADFDGDGDFTIFDFLAFQNAFDAGCA